MLRLPVRRSLLIALLGWSLGAGVGFSAPEAAAQFGGPAYRYGGVYGTGVSVYPRRASRGFSITIGGYNPYSGWGLSYRGLGSSAYPYGYEPGYGYGSAAGYGYGPAYGYGSRYSNYSPYATRYRSTYGRYSPYYGSSSAWDLYASPRVYATPRGYAHPHDGYVPTDRYHSDRYRDSIDDRYADPGVSSLYAPAPHDPVDAYGQADAYGDSILERSGAVTESPTSDLRPGMVLPDGSTVISVGPLEPAGSLESIPAGDEEDDEEDEETGEL